MDTENYLKLNFTYICIYRFLGEDVNWTWGKLKHNNE